MSVTYREPGVLYREHIPYRGYLAAQVVTQYVPDYQVFVTDRSGVPYVEIDSAILETVRWQLNAAGTCTFKAPILDPKVVTYPRLGEDEIQIRNETKLLWQGVPWRERQDHVFSSFECEGLLSYFTKRFITYTSLDYTSLDQFAIGLNLISHAQTGPNKDLNIDAATVGPSGKVRSRRYDRESHPNILDLLNEFPTLDDGFDFEIVVQQDGRREFTPYFPKKSNFRPNFVLEFGRNIGTFGNSVDATQLATEVYVTGGSNGPTKFEENFEDVAASSKYGVMTAIVSEGSQQDVTWLLDRAIAEVDQRNAPQSTPEITAINVPIVLLGVLQPGDVVPIRVKRGRVDIDGDYRILAIEWQVATNNLRIEVQEIRTAVGLLYPSEFLFPRSDLYPT